MITYRAYIRTVEGDHSHFKETLHFFSTPAPALIKHWFVPYEFLTVLHFYHPDLRFTAYDTDWPPSRLAEELTSSPLAAGLICAPKTCTEMQTFLGPQRFSAPSLVSQPNRLAPQPLAALSFIRSPQ